MAVWLIVFAFAAQAEESGTRIVDVLTKSDPYTLPRLKPLPSGLPDPREMPEDGEWRDKSHSHYRRGTFLPRPLDIEIMDRLEVCEGFPALAQVHIDSISRIEEKKRDETRQVTDAKWMIQQVDAQTALPAADFWGYVLAGAGGLAIGTLATLFFMTR